VRGPAVGTRFGRNRASRLARQLRRARGDEETFGVVDAQIDLGSKHRVDPGGVT
jgi:hypothetical protein